MQVNEDYASKAQISREFDADIVADRLLLFISAQQDITTCATTERLIV